MLPREVRLDKTALLIGFSGSKTFSFSLNVTLKEIFRKKNKLKSEDVSQFKAPNCNNSLHTLTLLSFL